MPLDLEEKEILGVVYGVPLDFKEEEILEALHEQVKYV